MSNSTNPAEAWWAKPDWLTAIGTIGSVMVALGVAIYSSFMTRRIEQKNRLTDVFRLLDDNAHRNARRRIVNLYGEKEDRRIKKILFLMGLKKDDIGREDAIYRESMEIVKADFNEIGSLLENKIILRDEFLKIYWLEVLKCWKVLYDDDIKPIREQLNYDGYMTSFESLKSFAESYKGTSINRIQITKDIVVYPDISSHEPADSTIISNIRPQIFAVFDEDMDEQTITKENMFVTEDETKTRLDGTVRWNPTLKTAIFESTKNLRNSKKYNVIISKKVRDRSGAHLKKDFSWSFYTHGSP